MDRSQTKRGGSPHRSSARKPPKKDAASDGSLLAVGIAKGCAVGIASGAVLILALSAAAYSMADPAKLTKIMGMASFAAAMIAAGGAAARFTKGGILSGVIAGAVLSAAVFVSSFIASGWDQSLDTTERLVSHLAALPLGALGAAVMKPREKKRKRRK